MFAWLKCAVCGHKLCKGQSGLTVSLQPSAAALIEIFCRGCKRLNYLVTR